MRRYKLTEVASRAGIDGHTLIDYIERDWISPAYADPTGGEPELDDEDLARIRLIHELMDDLGANAEAVPIILDLIDQLNLLQRAVRNRLAG
jgi:chaperone modulatory protein CbpM